MPICDICNKNMNWSDGYVLPTSQVATSEAYWGFAFSHQWSYMHSIDPDGDALANLAQQQAGQSSGWLMCESCSKLFSFDRQIARDHAKRRSSNPPGGGPTSVQEVALAAANVWNKLYGKWPSSVKKPAEAAIRGSGRTPSHDVKKVDEHTLAEMVRRGDIQGLCALFARGDWDAREWAVAALQNIHQAKKGEGVDYDKSEMLNALKEIIQACEAETSGGTYRTACLENAQSLLKQLEKPEPRVLATRSRLGREPLPGEGILLEEKAARRFLFWGHLDCRAIVTDKRLVFWDRCREKFSFEIPIDDLGDAWFGECLETDLLIHLKDGSKYEIGLEDKQQRQRLVDQLISQQTEGCR